MFATCPKRLRPLSALLLVALSGISAGALAADAEIVSLVGRGDTRPTARDEWKSAAVKQQLSAGSFVRTGDSSTIAILMRDNTQLRMNQNSMIQIKEVSPSGEPTKLELAQGRVWTQAKRKEYTAPGAGTTPAVTVQTPNAVAAIRGTDWELSVDKDGTALLTVLSGEVEFYNDLGRVSVKPNEQARVEKGKAPVKTLLTNAQDRVQWVTSYKPQPHRWLDAVPADLAAVVKAMDEERYGEAYQLLEKLHPASDSTALAPEQALLKADLLIFQGEAEQAAQVLEKTLIKYYSAPKHPLVVLRSGGKIPPQATPFGPRLGALLVRAYLITDKPADVQRVLRAFDDDKVTDRELELARGDFARFDGNAPGARSAFQAALEKDAKSADAWFGLGRVAAEREDVKGGRAALQEAIKLNPAGPGYRGELATLETFANEFAAAEAEFKAALEQQPDDYAALTGLGILQLKQGKPDDALESFLKAGVIEPRYARAQMYVGVAYYQLGNHPRAVEMFRRAATIDAKDPLPHMMLSLVAADRMEMGKAIAAARQASQLMPYLKSLNQLLNNQKGNANVGASLAQFGLEEWANAYAINSYSPYWAGSSLFLADRYSGDFTKNSELFKGFLADPTVFGASNRFNTLIASPGNYGTVGGRALDADTKERGLTANANGYNVSSIPFTYYLAADPTRIRPDNTDLRTDADNYTIGLGAKPNHELSLFAFANDFTANGKINSVDQGQLDTSIKQRRFDAGAAYKLSPTSQLWFKAGTGNNRDNTHGITPTPDAILNSPIGQVTGVAASGTLDRSNTQTTQHDVQFRQSVDLNDQWQFAWGVEAGKQSKNRQFQGNYPAAAVLTITGQNDDQRKSTELWVSNRYRVNNTLLLQGDLSHINLKAELASTNQVLFGLGGGLPQTTTDKKDLSEWNPRLGLAWNPESNQTLRIAAQKWRRPASVASLGNADTVGIAVDDRLVSLGGELTRLRVQYEWEYNENTFLQGYVDSRKIKNLANDLGTLVADVNLQDLERLRNRNRLSTQAIDFLEATPSFGEARVDTLGLAVNRVLADNLSGVARYQYNHSRNTGVGLTGNSVPWLPKNLANVGVNWLPVARWQLGAQATYRSSRYIDEANTSLLKAGWNFGLRSYWETADKKLSFEAILENVHSDKQSAQAHSPTFGGQLLYRF